MTGVPLGAVAAADGEVSVRVEVTGLRSHKGVVRACMTTDPARFPNCQDGAAYTLSVPATGTPVLEFPAVRPGRYAISILHDENGNGRVERALGMIPKEGFGFSRDAPVRFGPPSFAQAAFTVGTEAVHHTIRMRYML